MSIKRYPAQLNKINAGAGLRSIHYPELLNRKTTSIDWFEIITENFLTSKGRPRWILEKIRSDYPIAFHGVSLSIGSQDNLNVSYLTLLKNLIAEIDPFIVSDHFCWTGFQNNNSHNLLPLPLNSQSLESIISRIQQVQDFLGRKIIFENASLYLQSTKDTISEWDFISEVCQRSGCGLLLDLNNIYVSSLNFNIDPIKILSKIPVASVAQIHLAGHTNCGTYLFDTHSKPVQESVWKLYECWLKIQINEIPTMIEWDDEIPPLTRLEAEVQKLL